MVCPINKLIVTIEKKFQDQITHGTLKLYQDTRFHPEQHVTTMGSVVAVPIVLNDRLENKGIIQEVMVGDEICFSYQVIFDVDNQGNYRNMVWIDGKEYWFVEYSQVFCTRRNGKIMAIGGNVIVDEIESEELDEKFEGSFMIKPDMSKQKVYRGVGIVRHIGLPLTHEPSLDVKEGDEVYFRAEIAQAYEMYGKNRIVLRQKDLLAKAI